MGPEGRMPITLPSHTGLAAGPRGLQRSGLYATGVPPRLYAPTGPTSIEAL